MGTKKITWNLKEGLKRETPKSIKLIQKILVCLVGVWFMVVDPFYGDLFSAHALDLINRIAGSSVALIHFLFPYFGYKVPEEVNISE